MSRFKFPIAGKQQLYACCCNSPPPDPCRVFKGNANTSYTVTLPDVSVLVDAVGFGTCTGLCGAYKHWTFAMAAGYLAEAQTCTAGSGAYGCPAKQCAPSTPPYSNWQFVDTVPGTFTLEKCGPGGFACNEPPDNCCPCEDCASWATPPDACLHANIQLSVSCAAGPDGTVVANWHCSVALYITYSGSETAGGGSLAYLGPCCWQQPVTPNGQNDASWSFTGTGTINADGSANPPTTWSGGGKQPLGWCCGCGPACPLGSPGPCGCTDAQFPSTNFVTLGSISVS